jgi:glutathione S-transferase
MLLYVDSRMISPYALSAFVALKEKGVAFDLQRVDLAHGAHLEPAYSRTSLTQRVPTLVDGDLAVSESSAIAEYLEDAVAGRRLYPADIRQRAQARQIQAWLRSDLMPLREERPTEVIFLGRSSPGLSEPARAAARKLFALADALLEQGRQNLFGEWSIADTDLALMLNRLVMGGDPVPERLAAYVHAQWAREPVQAWLTLVESSDRPAAGGRLSSDGHISSLR